ncbi:MAG: type II secretion system F family protein [Verrucomicrobiales bacterium]|nr:type II secretion system F family protein [Verrucomicrobiales bacterium]MBP9224628.1 type II secretion system F family protein [Verrucomicrobiales bacterium]
MLKKVSLTNIHTGRKSVTLVDTGTDEKALVGSGKTAVETAEISDVKGIDETIQRLTGKKNSLDDRVALFNGLAKCFDRNIPIIKSFHLQANRVRTPRFRGIIADVSHDLTQGEKISDAMQKKGDVFTPDIIALIRAGEESGRLPEIFRRLGNSQKKTSRIINKLKSGMIYPAVVTCLGLVVVIVMSFTLVPAMSSLYASLNTELPLATRGMMAFSNILLKQPWIVAFPILGIVAFFKNWGRISRIPSVQTFFLKMPGISGLVRKSASAVGFRTLALLIEANVRLTTALDITGQTSWHHHYKTFFERVKNHILAGLTLPDAFLIESHWLGNDGRMICGLMETAAETGSGTELLNEIAEDYEDELDTAANQIDKLIEPVTIVLLGSLVGFLVYAIYAPVFSLGDALLKKK